MYVDLHIHSTVSDGTMTPEEIVEAAVRADVHLLAIADHDLVEGNLSAQPLCRAAGIRCVPAVENTCQFGDAFHHVLSYNADLTDENYLEIVRHNRAALDWMSVELIRRMIPDYPLLSLADYDAFERDVRLGGWKALDYLYKKGVSENFIDGLGFYGRYGVAYRDAGFRDIRETIAAIHGAGGVAVLAHPGETIETEDIASFRAELIRLIELGLDGVECYYPSHGEAVLNTCLDVCKARDMIITTGADCHGSFTGEPIGSMRVGMDKLNLNGVVPRDFP